MAKRSVSWRMVARSSQGGILNYGYSYSYSWVAPRRRAAAVHAPIRPA